MIKPARIFVFALILLFSLSPLFSSTFLYSAFAVSSGDVVINEIQADSIDGAGGDKDDWIKLYNSTGSSIDLAAEGYRIEKTKTSTNPSIVMRIGNASDGTYPGGTTIPAGGFYLIVRDDAEQSLKDKADAVGTRSEFTWTGSGYTFYLGTGAISSDGDSDIVDKVGFGAATYFEGIGPAPVIPDGGAIVRDPIGQDTDDNSVDFVESVGVPDEDPPEEKEEVVYSDQIFLNEIMPNPEGSDDNEYLELYNASNEDVDLTGWVIKDLTGEVTPSSTLIPAGSFLVIYKKDGSVHLNNDGDTIRIFNPNGGVADEVVYPKIKEGLVYQRYPDGSVDWSESNQPSAGAANKPSSNSSTSSNEPKVTFFVDDTNLKVNQSFDVKVEIKNAKGLHDYYVKIRLGLEESKLTKGRTYFSFYDTWLWDGKSWTDFPILYTDSEGVFEGTIKAKVNSGNPAGTYYVEVRIRDKEAEKNYDSESQTLSFGEEDLQVAADTLSSEGVVLGTLTELPATGGGSWIPVFAWMVLIFIGSSLPGTSVSSSRTVDFAAHKAVHLFEYSILFILINRAVKRSVKMWSKLTTAVGKLDTLISFGLTVGYAVTDEIHQFFVRGRDARLTDVLIDATAAFLAWLVVRRKKLVAVVAAVLLGLLGVSPLQAADVISLAVPEGYELKEGEIDHTSATTWLSETHGAAIHFRPNFNFDLAGFATFVYSNEAYFGELEPSAFGLSIYEGMMEHIDFDLPPLVNFQTPTESVVVQGSESTGFNYQLFFGFEPIEVKSGESYTAILTVEESDVRRYKFWVRNVYHDGFTLAFDPQTQEFFEFGGASMGAPFGLFVEEGWQGTPPRFRPVVLVHGMGGKPSDWRLSEQDYVALVREMYATDEEFSYPSSWIHTYHYGNVGGEYNYQGDIRDIALGLEAVVDDLATRYAESFGETLESLEERDEDRVVDIVGYSMGGLVARQYLTKHLDDHHVRKLVTVATPNQGVYWLGRKEEVGKFSRFGPRLEDAVGEIWDTFVAFFDRTGQPLSLESTAALQMIPRSEFFSFLNLIEWTPLDVGYHTIYGDIDIVFKEKIFFFTMEEKIALGDGFIFSESAIAIPAVEPQAFGYNEEWTFPIGVSVTPDGVSAKFYIEGLDLTKFRFWHLNILRQQEIKDKIVEILVD